MFLNCMNFLKLEFENYETKSALKDATNANLQEARAVYAS